MQLGGVWKFFLIARASKFTFSKHSRGSKYYYYLLKIGMQLPFTLENKRKNKILKFGLIKRPFWKPLKKCVFGFWRKPPKIFFFFVFQLWFSFKNKRCTNVLLVAIFENTQTKVINCQKHHFGRFWQLIMVLFCVFKNTD